MKAIEKLQQALKEAGIEAEAHFGVDGRGPITREVDELSINEVAVEGGELKASLNFMFDHENEVLVGVYITPNVD